jgi:hypothetical protein
LSATIQQSGPEPCPHVVWHSLAVFPFESQVCQQAEVMLQVGTEGDPLDPEVLEVDELLDDVDEPPDVEDPPEEDEPPDDEEPPDELPPETPHGPLRSVHPAGFGLCVSAHAASASAFGQS